MFAETKNSIFYFLIEIFPFALDLLALPFEHTHSSAVNAIGPCFYIKMIGLILLAAEYLYMAEIMHKLRCYFDISLLMHIDDKFINNLIGFLLVCIGQCEFLVKLLVTSSMPSGWLLNSR